jgi:hypothetical protein
MSKSSEYRQYARECIESARTATTEEVRRQFLELAKVWTTAAAQIDNGVAAHHPAAPSVNRDNTTEH